MACITCVCVCVLDHADCPTNLFILFRKRPFVKKIQLHLHFFQLLLPLVNDLVTALAMYIICSERLHDGQFVILI